MTSALPDARPAWSQFVVIARQSVLTDIVETVTRGAALLALTGSPGSGKTTFAWAIQQELENRSMRVLRVGRGTGEQIDLRALACQLLEKPEDDFDTGDIEALFGVMTMRSSADQELVLIIDDAELLCSDVLGYLRLLAKIAIEAMPRIVFVGRPSFWNVTEDRSRSAIQELITERRDLAALSYEEARTFARLCLPLAEAGEDTLDCLVRHGNGLIGRIASLVVLAETIKIDRDPPELTAAAIDAAAAQLNTAAEAAVTLPGQGIRAEVPESREVSATVSAPGGDRVSRRPRLMPMVSVALAGAAACVVVYWQLASRDSELRANSIALPKIEMPSSTASLAVKAAPASTVTALSVRPEEVAVEVARGDQPASAVASRSRFDNPAASPAHVVIPWPAEQAVAYATVDGETANSDTASAESDTAKPLVETKERAEIAPITARAAPVSIARAWLLADTLDEAAAGYSPAPGIPPREQEGSATVQVAGAPASVRAWLLADVLDEAAASYSPAPGIPPRQQENNNISQIVQPPDAPTPNKPAFADSVRQSAAATPAPAPPTQVQNSGTSPSDAVSDVAAHAGATPSELASLLSRGDAMLAFGDILAARLLYERAAVLGAAHAATSLGKTYDADFLASIQATGVIPDRALAASWYRKGATLGDAEGARRLATLTADQ